MNKDDFKKLLEESLKPIKEDIKDIKDVQKDHTIRLEALSGDVEQLHDDVKTMKDKQGMYHSRNKREIDEIKKHLGLPTISDIPEV